MRLQAAVRSLKEHKRFGLVFEEHIPEVAAIPGVTVAGGDLVMDRTDSDGRLYRVRRLLKRDADVAPVAGGETAMSVGPGGRRFAVLSFMTMRPSWPGRGW